MSILVYMDQFYGYLTPQYPFPSLYSQVQSIWMTFKHCSPAPSSPQLDTDPASKFEAAHRHGKSDSASDRPQWAVELLLLGGAYEGIEVEAGAG